MSYYSSFSNSTISLFQEKTPHAQRDNRQEATKLNSGKYCFNLDVGKRKRKRKRR